MAIKAEAKNSPPDYHERCVLSVVISLLLLLLWLTIRLSREKAFSIDEFQYAHASWLVAEGQVPYRDFFEVHFPLLYQYLSPYWLLVDDSPTHIGQLRFFMLPILAIGLVFLAMMARREEKLIPSLLAVIFALGCAPFIAFATELRPDAVAFAFYAAALGIYYVNRLSLKKRAFCGGLFLVAAFWSSQKAWFYGLPLIIAWGLDLYSLIKKRGGDNVRFILGHPILLSLGVLVGLLPILIYLFATKSWAALYSWCIKWALEYQQRYPTFAWFRAFKPFLYAYPDYLILGAAGVVGTIIKYREHIKRYRDDGRASGIEIVIMASLFTTFLSFSLQRAPWGYSMIPFLGFLAVFASRGFIDILFIILGRTNGQRNVRFVIVASGALLAMLTIRSIAILIPVIERNNTYQLRVLDKIHRLTDSSEFLYDNSGTFIARPHAYFYYYTEKSIRIFEAARLIREVPQAIERTGAIMMVVDARYIGLPLKLRDYLEENYQDYNGDIKIWGRKYSGPGEFEFNAIKRGEYFVVHAGIPESQEDLAQVQKGIEIKLDDQHVSDQIFTLEKGKHIISTGAQAEFYVLWLPRDRKIWFPNPKAIPRFSNLL